MCRQHLKPVVIASGKRDDAEHSSSSELQP